MELLTTLYATRLELGTFCYLLVAVVVLSRREIQSGGRGIITASTRRSKSDSRDVAGGSSASDDDDRDDELYNRYIAPWRPDYNASESRSSSHHDADLTYGRQPVKIASVPRVSR